LNNYPELELRLITFKPNYNLAIIFNESLGSEKIQYPKDNTINGINYPKTTDFVPLDYDKLRVDFQFQMLMEHAKKYQEYKLWRYQVVESAVAAIVDFFHSELKK
jgi:hypothetical protein